VVDISVRDPPPLVYSVLARSPVSVIRLTPNVKLSQVSHALPEKPAGLTVVHFWMEKSCLLPAFPEPIVARITKVVFTVRHYAAVPLWLQWYELQNTQYPNLASVVFVFPSDGGPRWITDPIYLHRENTTQHRPYMFAAFAEQVAAILLSTQAHISIVALRDVPHQRFLGLPIVESVSGVELEECFLDQVETELHRLAPEVNVGLDTIPFCLARIETIPLPEYRGRLGRDEFELEVNA
jgi:hypothetical protein